MRAQTQKAPRRGFFHRTWKIWLREPEYAETCQFRDIGCLQIFSPATDNNSSIRRRQRLITSRRAVKLQADFVDQTPPVRARVLPAQLAKRALRLRSPSYRHQRDLHAALSNRLAEEGLYSSCVAASLLRSMQDVARYNGRCAHRPHPCLPNGRPVRKPAPLASLSSPTRAATGTRLNKSPVHFRFARSHGHTEQRRQNSRW